jgi:hypothetical protein
MRSTIEKAAFSMIIFLVLVSVVSGSQMAFVEEEEKGWLTLKEGKVDILTYRFGDQLKQGVNPSQTRSCYIHPLYSLDGRPLTDDFPDDHLHHHGLCWTWPVVKTRGQETQTWHPANLRQYFLRWLKREAQGKSAVLCVENAWKLDGNEVVAKEILRLKVQPAGEYGRAIDVELTFEAVGGPLVLQGTPEGNKGYGGLTLRGAPAFKGQPLTTAQGKYEGEPNNVTLQWASMSAEGMGVAIFVSPDHPDFPPAWVLRTSYAGLLNVSWPGSESIQFHPGKPKTLRYRIFIHRGGMNQEKIHQIYKQYLSGFKKE